MSVPSSAREARLPLGGGGGGAGAVGARPVAVPYMPRPSPRWRRRDCCRAAAATHQVSGAAAVRRRGGGVKPLSSRRRCGGAGGRTGDTDRERSPCTSAPQRVSGTFGATLGLSPLTLGNNYRRSNRGNTTVDQHQLVRYCHTCMFRVRSAFISRLKGYKSHNMGHDGLPLPSSL